MAKADVNKDGREDIFIGGAKGQPCELFLQTATGKHAVGHRCRKYSPLLFWELQGYVLLQAG